MNVKFYNYINSLWNSIFSTQIYLNLIINFKFPELQFTQKSHLTKSQCAEN